MAICHAVNGGQYSMVATARCGLEIVLPEFGSTIMTLHSCSYSYVWNQNTGNASIWRKFWKTVHIYICNSTRYTVVSLSSQGRTSNTFEAIAIALHFSMEESNQSISTRCYNTEIASVLNAHYGKCKRTNTFVNRRRTMRFRRYTAGSLLIKSIGCNVIRRVDKTRVVT